MKTFVAISVFMLCYASGYSQSVTVGRQVIGSTGSLSVQGDVSVNSSVGECVIATGTGTGITATQGFEQPMSKTLIVAEILTFPESCRGANNGAASIDSISGCEEPYNIIWDSGSSGYSVSGLSSGSHLVSIVTEFCQVEIPFFIGLESDADCSLVFYSGITPNEDGDNDYWHIENIELPQFSNNTVRVFNRWGDEVWTAKGYDNVDVRWQGQGRSDGNLPDGTYFYVVEVNDTTYKGYIELTR